MTVLFIKIDFLNESFNLMEINSALLFCINSPSLAILFSYAKNVTERRYVL